MSRLILIGIAVLTLLANTSAAADEINFDEAIGALTGKTWSGNNERGSAFWFWHDGGPTDGPFKAKFGSRGKVHTGTWKREANRICWLWSNSGDRVCYTKFDLSGNSLKMTRSDGVVSSGNLEEGNTEGM